MGNPNLEGGCACGAIRYKLTATPLIVHACHCRDCQRLTGSAFVTNIWIERKFVEAIGPEPKSFRLAGGSGQHHDVFFCGDCGTYVGAAITARPATFGSCAPARSTLRKRPGPTFTSLPGAKRRGWNCQRMCRRSRSSTSSATSGPPKAWKECAAPARADLSGAWCQPVEFRHSGNDRLEACPTQSIRDSGTGIPAYLVLTVVQASSL